MALTLEQRIERKNGLGGSDIAAILGLSRYASPLDIYNDKVGELAEDIGNEATNRGNLLEPIIIEMLQQQVNDTIDTQLDTYIHPSYPFLRANIDGYYGKGIIVEAKSCHMWSKAAKEFGEEGTDQIPTEYLVQCAFYAEVVAPFYDALDFISVIIPVAFVKDNSGILESIDRFALYSYQRNEQLGESIIAKAVAFWENHVIPRIPPAGESLRKANPFVEAKEADAETQEALVLLKSVNAQIKELTEYKGSLMKSIEDYIEEYEMLKDPKGKELASWKMQYSNRFDLKAFEVDHPDLYKQYQKQITSRVFRLKD